MRTTGESAMIIQEPRDHLILDSPDGPSVLSGVSADANWAMKSSRGTSHWGIVPKLAVAEKDNGW